MSPADVPQMWPQEKGLWGAQLPDSNAFVHVHSGVGSSLPPPLPLIPVVSRLFEVEPTCRKEAGIDWCRALEEECVTLSSRLPFLPFFPPSITAPHLSLLLLFTLSRHLLPPPTSPAVKPRRACCPGCDIIEQSGELQTWNLILAGPERERTRRRAERGW